MFLVQLPTTVQFFDYFLKVYLHLHPCLGIWLLVIPGGQILAKDTHAFEDNVAYTHTLLVGYGAAFGRCEVGVLINRIEYGVNWLMGIVHHMFNSLAHLP